MSQYPIEGLNEASGRLTWLYRVGAVKQLLGGSGVAVASSDQIVVPDLAGTTHLLNIDTGAVTAPPTTSPLWCPTEEVFADQKVAPSPLNRIGSEAFTARAMPAPKSPTSPPEAVVAGRHGAWVAKSGIAVPL